MSITAEEFGARRKKILDFIGEDIFILLKSACEIQTLESLTLHLNRSVPITENLLRLLKQLTSLRFLKLVSWKKLAEFDSCDINLK